jgi:hypothetical protein
MFTARASAILFTSRPPFCLRHTTVDCCLTAIATVEHNRHIAYSMHVTLYWVYNACFDFRYSVYAKRVFPYKYLARNWCKNDVGLHVGNVSVIGVIF